MRFAAKRVYLHNYFTTTIYAIFRLYYFSLRLAGSRFGFVHFSAVFCAIILPDWSIWTHQPFPQFTTQKDTRVGATNFNRSSIIFRRLQIFMLLHLIMIKQQTQQKSFLQTFRINCTGQYIDILLQSLLWKEQTAKNHIWDLLLGIIILTVKFKSMMYL